MYVGSAHFLYIPLVVSDLAILQRYIEVNPETEKKKGYLTAIELKRIGEGEGRKETAWEMGDNRPR